jgi:hypothetical protein
MYRYHTLVGSVPRGLHSWVFMHVAMREAVRVGGAEKMGKKPHVKNEVFVHLGI